MNDLIQSGPDDLPEPPDKEFPAPAPLSLIDLAREDLAAARRRDPAARSSLEVALLYPGVHALWAHRAAHRLWHTGHKFAARALAQAARAAKSIEIHPAAKIGRRFFIDHGMGGAR